MDYYSFLADGMKTSALKSNGEGLVYRGGMVFRRDTDGTLRFESAPLATGRMTADGIQYHITDHLGSVRAVIDAATGDILEASEYTAFGERTDITSAVRHGLGQVSSFGDPSLRHHFSGKEDQTPDFSVSSADFGARHYAPHLSRWIVPDPMGEKYYDISPYVYCAGDPIVMIDPDGNDWYRHQEEGKDEYSYTDAHSQAELESMGISDGQYLGEAVVLFAGRNDERIGTHKTMKDDDAIPAIVTIYGINGEDDVNTYESGLSITSDDTQYPKISVGEYKMFQQQMATSVYGKGSLTYRIKRLDGSLTLSSPDTERLITEVFFHRTNNDGDATRSSVACLVIDGRDWKSVEKQLGHSQSIYLILTRE